MPCIGTTEIGMQRRRVDRAGRDVDDKKVVEELWMEVGVVLVGAVSSLLYAASPCNAVNCVSILISWIETGCNRCGWAERLRKLNTLLSK
jgi:hypothetical protein